MALPILTALSVSHCLDDLPQSPLPAIYSNHEQNLSLSFAEIGLVTLVFLVTASLLRSAICMGGSFAVHTSLDFVYRVCSILPAIGVLMALMPKSEK
ncbi:MAG: hypothetical protein H6872_15725 [Methylobacteriaceae bacterium]|nr:hypothetical protein [Rhodoblastus sp.]MCC0006494.1 hypothetical protein [Methylobacteriaceae bacterium]